MISEKALEARRKYMKQYGEQNRERILERQRDHYHNHREKYVEYQRNYWERKANEATNG
jgi:hypothetical protein